MWESAQSRTVCPPPLETVRNQETFAQMTTNRGSAPQGGLRAPRLGGHIVGKHRVEMDASLMATNREDLMASMNRMRMCRVCSGS